MAKGDRFTGSARRVQPFAYTQTRNAEVFPNIGRLNEYWHAIALSQELRSRTSIKRSLYGQPLLLWRDSANNVFAVLDCCAHRRAPLEVQDYSSNRIVCPYHGWQYDSQGQLVDVPSNRSAVQKLKCSIPAFTVIEESGFVWLLPPGAASQSPESRPSLTKYDKWPNVCKQRVFDTSVDLLVDNFMDPTHTGLVHDGLIRNSSQIADHQLTIQTSQQGVRVDYAEQEEQVGFGMRLLFGKTMRTEHRDEFLAPNLVRVTYFINGTERFVALIACVSMTPEDSPNPKTLALVQLRFYFGRFSWLLSPLVSALAKKVLKQDFTITRDQWANQQIFTQQREHLVAADAVASRVMRFRKRLKEGEIPSEASEHKMTLRF